MKIYQKLLANLSNQHGGVLVLVALLLFVFIGIAALAIDIGYISTTKNELQNVSDAAALAATGKLGQIYVENTVYVHATDYALIKDVVKNGLTNRAAGLDIKFVEAEIVVGQWNYKTHSLNSAQTTFPNAVRVTARRDTLINGSINSIFAGIFGIDTFDLRVEATASLSGDGDLEPGEAKMPIGVSEQWFWDTDNDGEPDGCRDEIHLNNTGTSCAGWHTYTSTSTDTPEVRKQAYGTILNYTSEQQTKADEDEDYDYAVSLDFLDAPNPTNSPYPRFPYNGYNSASNLEWLGNYTNMRALSESDSTSALDNEGMAWLLVKSRGVPSAINYFVNLNPNTPTPYLTPGTDGESIDFEFTGGVNATVFGEDEALPALFNFFKVRDDFKDFEDREDLNMSAEEHIKYENSIWRTTVPVYADPGDSCRNPNTNIRITGTVDIIVENINSATNDVAISLECSHKNLRGSGGTGGVIGAIPNLVK